MFYLVCLERDLESSFWGFLAAVWVFIGFVLFSFRLQSAFVCIEEIFWCFLRLGWNLF